MNRRKFLLSTGAAPVAFGLASCGISTGAHGQAASPYRGELRTIALAAALENQAVSVYRTVLAAAHAGRFGPSAPAFISFAGACLGQHARHAQAWNAILRAAGKPSVTSVPLAGSAAVMRAVRSASTLDQAAALAIRLENQAAQTYVAAAASITSPAGVAAAAHIAPVEAMHAATLSVIAHGWSVTVNDVPPPRPGARERDRGRGGNAGR